MATLNTTGSTAGASAGWREDRAIPGRARAYRSREGQWAWLLHRITGLGVLAFICLHILDTSLMLYGEDAYNHLIKGVYQAWWFQPMEIALGGALVYHALNGLRIILIDFWEDGIRYERQVRAVLLALFFATMVPMTAVMLWPFVFGR